MNIKTDKIKNSRKMLLMDLLILVLSLAADQFSKLQIRKNLPERSYFDVIPGVLQIFHHENFGATWGIMKGKTVVFLIIAVVVVLGLSILISRIPPERKFVMLNITSTLILSGALGNSIDRIQKQSVTDFIYVSLINFPIFNVADIYIVVATITIMFLVTFYYKDEDLKFLEFGKNRSQKNAESGAEDR